MRHVSNMATGRTRTYLTKQDKQDIREQFNDGVPAWKLAEWYGIPEFTVHKITGVLQQ